MVLTVVDIISRCLRSDEEAQRPSNPRYRGPLASTSELVMPLPESSIAASSEQALLTKDAAASTQLSKVVALGLEEAARHHWKETRIYPGAYFLGSLCTIMTAAIALERALSPAAGAAAVTSGVEVSVGWALSALIFMGAAAVHWYEKRREAKLSSQLLATPEIADSLKELEACAHEPGTLSPAVDRLGGLIARSGSKSFSAFASQILVEGISRLPQVARVYALTDFLERISPSCAHSSSRERALQELCILALVSTISEGDRLHLCKCIVRYPYPFKCQTPGAEQLAQKLFELAQSVNDSVLVGQFCAYAERITAEYHLIQENVIGLRTDNVR